MKNPDEGLNRAIGLVGSAMLALNGIIGAGIFALPGRLHADFGAFSPWLFPIFGLLVFLIVLPLGEVAGFFDRTGGPVIYTREAFGPFASFQTGWAYYVARLTAGAANSNVFVAYAASLIPGLGEGAPRAGVIIGVYLILTSLNIIGVKRAIRALDAASVLKIAPILILAAIGLGRNGLGGAALTDFALPFDKIGAASLLVLYAFVGFETSIILGGETKDARRSIPRAMIATLVVSIAVYFIIQLAYVATMEGKPVERAPLVAYGEALLGNFGGGLMILAALFSIFGNQMASMMSTPRVTFALSRAGQLPGWFGETSARFATPANSIAFRGAVECALALTGGFAFLAVVSVLARLFVYAASLAALPVIRRLRGAAPRRGADRLLAPALLGGGLLFCAWAISRSSADSWKMFAALLLAGSALYALERFFLPLIAKNRP